MKNPVTSGYQLSAIGTYCLVVRSWRRDDRSISKKVLGTLSFSQFFYSLVSSNKCLILALNQLIERKFYDANALLYVIETLRFCGWILTSKTNFFKYWMGSIKSIDMVYFDLTVILIVSNKTKFDLNCNFPNLLYVLSVVSSEQD